MKQETPKPDIHRLIELQAFLLHFRNIDRVIRVPKDATHVRENDVEHSYTLAMAAWFLAQYFPELDKDCVIRFALAHDLVEMYAGDTYIFADKTLLDTKKQREEKAARRIGVEWPDFQEMNESITAYEAKDSPEALFVYALDKIMPILVNVLTEGHTWKLESITLKQLHDNKLDKVSVSPEIRPYYDQLYELLRENIHWFNAAR